MFLVCYSQESVWILDDTGRYKSRIGKVGTGNLEFSSPCGIALSDNTMNVADKDNHRIQMLTTGRRILGMFW